MNLTVIQYDVIMEAINQAFNTIAEDNFIDPYAENPDGYTNETLFQALKEVEQQIISENIPLI